MQTDEGHKLEALIKKAISDLELTTSEYEEIMAQANADGHVDSDEWKLLTDFKRRGAEGVRLERKQGKAGEDHKKSQPAEYSR